jgi:hypothetical protein
MLAQPNCCSEPNLETVRRLIEPPASWRDLMKCRNCNAFWQLDGQERMSMDGEDHVWEWYTRLTEDEAEAMP